MIQKIKNIFSYNILKTIYLNLRLFPLHTAIKLPLKIGYRVDIHGLYRGCIQFKPGIKIKRYMIRIGISEYPMVSTKGLYTLLRFGRNGLIEFGDKILIHNGVSLIVSENGKISIGSDCLINQLTKIYANSLVKIGDHCRIGWECQLLDSDCHLIYNDVKRRIQSPISPIEIGNNVWIASRTTILKGVTIPPYSIISGNSLVNKSFKDIETTGNLFIGSPATLKATGLFRLLNEKFETEMKQYFISTGTKYIEADNIPHFDYKNYLKR